MGYVMHGEKHMVLYSVVSKQCGRKNTSPIAISAAAARSRRQIKTGRRSFSTPLARVGFLVVRWRFVKQNSRLLSSRLSHRHVLSTHFASPQRDGQAELTWVL